MTHNEIKYNCDKCDCKTADVQCKLSINSKIKVQIKCDSCNRNHFLDENDNRCTKFFKQ